MLFHVGEADVRTLKRTRLRTFKGALTTTLVRSLKGIHIGTLIEYLLLWVYIVEARKLEHQYPHALQVKDRGS